MPAGPRGDPLVSWRAPSLVSFLHGRAVRHDFFLIVFAHETVLNQKKKAV